MAHISERGGSSLLQVVVCRISLALALLGVGGLPFLAVAETASEAERIARLAMSTASLWMIEHHLFEIDEGFEKGDFAEALEESEELLSWMRGAPWLHELASPVKAATEAVEMVVHKIKSRDMESAKAATKEMKTKMHHLHHELMQLVARSGKSGSHNH